MPAPVDMTRAPARVMVVTELRARHTPPPLPVLLRLDGTRATPETHPSLDHVPVPDGCGARFAAVRRCESPYAKAGY
ncbi:hypothetical protein GCM10010278_79570 [Streptomyces melanogenes]|nr:hypothetical protein GCM10010278_79570 [Streptomyces melanogenes]